MPDESGAPIDYEALLTDHLSRHRSMEQEFVSEYRQIAEGASSPTLSYLGQLVVEDQERHQRFFRDLEDAARRLMELRESEGGSVDLGYLLERREEVLAATVRFVQFEREDASELARIAAELDPVRDKFWHLLLNLAHDEIDRHARVLEFVRDRALHATVHELET